MTNQCHCPPNQHTLPAPQTTRHHQCLRRHRTVPGALVPLHDHYTLGMGPACMFHQLHIATTHNFATLPDKGVCIPYMHMQEMYAKTCIHIHGDTTPALYSIVPVDYLPSPVKDFHFPQRQVIQCAVQCHVSVIRPFLCSQDGVLCVTYNIIKSRKLDIVWHTEGK